MSAALSPSAKLTPHFTARELRADTPGIAPNEVSNLYRVAAYLEVIRRLCGDRPIIVTSGYRTPQHNERVGGSSTSSHVTGLAADFTVDGLTQFELYQILSEARKIGALPIFDQIIFYPVTGHTHLGLGDRERGEFRIRLHESSGGTPLLSSGLLAKLPGFASQIAGEVASVVAHPSTWLLPAFLLLLALAGYLMVIA